MIYLSLILAMMPSADLPYWVPEALRDTNAYQLTSKSPSVRKNGYASFKRLSDESVIRFTVRATSDPFAEYGDRNARVTLFDEPSDGYPLGNVCEIYRSEARIDLQFKAGREDVRIELRLAKGSNGSLDFSKEEPWLVAVARELMALYASRRAGDMGSLAVRGSDVPSFVAKETDVRYVELAAYVAAMGEQLTNNKKDKRYAFSHGGENYLALLGTSKIRVGSHWTAMADTPMLVGGKVFVPAALLPD